MDVVLSYENIGQNMQGPNPKMFSIYFSVFIIKMTNINKLENVHTKEGHHYGSHGELWFGILIMVFSFPVENNN